MKKPMDNKRSDKWPALRKKFLKDKTCAVCGGKRKLEAHHVLPFHINRAKELDVQNLMPLCEGNPSLNCHLVVGHLFNFKGFNPQAVDDAANIRFKVAENKKRIGGFKK
jgi:HNH endonuclease